MAEVGIKELKEQASRVIDEVAGGASYVVTRRGKPAAVIMPIDDAEDVVLANADEFVKMRRKARRDFAQGRTSSLDELA